MGNISNLKLVYCNLFIAVSSEKPWFDCNIARTPQGPVSGGHDLFPIH